jgi:hypothetical protein
MKKYLYIAAISALIALLVECYKVYNDLEKYKELYAREQLNVEAYEQYSSTLRDELREFQFTMDELRASRDSINNKILAEIDRLKIKDKNVQYLQYNTSVINKVDTIMMSDTIFKEPVAIDTIIGDRWYTMKLGLKYPSTIVTEPTFTSEKYVVISTKKEYNKTPSKIFFIRWFQKKHTVVTVDMEEKNPYIKNKDSRFIKIVKD